MKIALISCSKKKVDYTCQAKILYSPSTLFTYSYNYAKTLCDKVFILSAKYGLLNENDIVSPYDLTLNNQSKKQKEEWSNCVFKNMENTFDLLNDEFFFFCGENYRKFLVPLLKEKYNTKITIPLEKLPLGEQLKFLKNKINN